MAINVIMPQMGESVFEGTVTKWLKQIGDKVTRDEPLFEISTDKVDSEIPSPASGILSEILVPEGQTVKISAVVAIIDEPEAEAISMEAPAMREIEMASPTVPGEGAIDTAPPSAPVSEPVEANAPPAVAEPAAELPAGQPAAIEERPLQAAIEVTAPETESSALPDLSEAPGTETRSETIETPRIELRPGMVRTSPLVRRIARDCGVDLSQIRGTGLSGRITKGDVLGYLEKLREQDVQPAMAPQPAMPHDEKSMQTGELPREAPVAEPVHQVQTAQPVPAPQAAPLPETPGLLPPAEIPAFPGETEIVTMTPMRKAIAERMLISRRSSAHVHTVFEADVTSIVQLHEKHKGEFQAREGYKLSYTPFFVKAFVDTVRDFPILNCSVSGDTIVFKKPINVGLAVALETGLIVPVIRDAHLKSFRGLAHAIRDLAERARTKKLKPEEVQHGTITITNPGIFGSLFGVPIINQPQVAILGVGSLEKRPVIINDAIAIRTMVYLVLSFDHRVIDGAVADQFMAALKSRLQSWNQWED